MATLHPWSANLAPAPQLTRRVAPRTLETLPKILLRCKPLLRRGTEGMTTTPDETSPVQTLPDLSISHIETIPIRVPARPDLSRQPLPDDAPLDDRHADQHRRRHRRRGLRRRRGRGPARDRRDRPRRDRSAADRRGRVSRSSGAGSSRGRRRSTSCATAASGLSRARASTPRSGMRSARRSASRCGGSGAATATRLPMITIGGYYDASSDVSQEVEEPARAWAWRA